MFILTQILCQPLSTTLLLQPGDAHQPEPVNVEEVVQSQFKASQTENVLSESGNKPMQPSNMEGLKAIFKASI